MTKQAQDREHYNGEQKATAEHRNTVIQIRSERFDLGAKKDLIGQTISKLDSYLDTFIPKGRRGTSKHSLLGPAGKLIGIMRSDKLATKQALIGQIVSIHENTGNRITVDASKKLEEAVESIVKTMTDVPKTKRLRVLSEIDYGLYFTRKRKLLEYLDDMQKRWTKFLQDKYKTINDLNMAWGLTDQTAIKPLADFQKLMPPTMSFQRKVNSLEQAKKDIEEFRNRARVELVEEEEEVGGVEHEEAEE